jgi:hypothetical protein
MYKSILGDAKKVVTCKILSQQALGTPMLPIGCGVGYSNVSRCIRVHYLNLIVDPLD